MGKLKSILKRVGLGLLLVVVLLGVVYLALPQGPRDPMVYDDPWHAPRTMVRAREQVVVTGTPWATRAALDVLDHGGNAFDAAVAALLVLNVTHGEASSFPGIAPLLIYDAGTGQVRSYVGAGTAPAKATDELFLAKGYKTMPDLNIWAQLVPASPDVIVALLRDYGTRSFTEVSAPAIQIARQGFPATVIMTKNMNLSLPERIVYTFLFPYNSQIYFHGEWWRPFQARDRVANLDLARTLETLAGQEQQALQSGGTREQGLQAVRDYFYKGPLARTIVDFNQKNGGLFSAEDLANYSGYWETPIQGSYGDYTFYTNGPWNQGIVVPLTLQILEGIDLKAMGHNSPQYIHTVSQALDLAMADRDAYVADPKFVNVPVAQLLSKSYAAARRSQMTARAFPQLPPPGNLGSGVVPAANLETSPVVTGDLHVGKDTTELAIIDRWGNSITLTPSDFPKSPMVPGTGMNLGNRMIQFRLDPNNVDVVAPGKRPRVTPHAVIVFKQNKFWMSYGTPGGDTQPQTNVQVFLNMAVFGMSVQDAINAPRFRSDNAPSSFAPHPFKNATLDVEQDLYDQVAPGLQQLGYTVIKYSKWDNEFGSAGAVLREGDQLLAGADPREETWADGR